MAAQLNGSGKPNKFTKMQLASIEADMAAQAKLREDKMNDTEAETLRAASVKPDAEFGYEELKAAAVDAMMKLFGVDEDAPSWKRKLAALFATVVIAGGAGYGIGYLASMAIVGIAAMGGSVLWSFLIMISALILAGYIGAKIGQHVGGYILSGQIDRDVVAAKNKVFGWFKRDPKPIGVSA